MDDLISRQAAIDAIWDGINMDIYTREVKEILEELPTAEPKSGKWVLTADGYRCTRCNHKAQTTGLPMYCPNCGAKMEGE